MGTLLSDSDYLFNKNIANISSNQTEIFAYDEKDVLVIRNQNMANF